MASSNTPPLDEFIDMSARRSQRQHGFEGLDGKVTAAVYGTKGEYAILTIRFADDIAAKHRLLLGMRMTCHIHPDQGHIALRPGGHSRNGSKLFRPKGAKSLVYQTTVRKGMLNEHAAVDVELTDTDEGAVIITLPNAGQAGWPPAGP